MKIDFIILYVCAENIKLLLFDVYYFNGLSKSYMGAQPVLLTMNNLILIKWDKAITAEKEKSV